MNATSPYPQLSREFIAEQDPEWLIVSAPPDQADADPRDLVPEGPALRNTTAWEEGNFVVVGTNNVSQPAPRIVSPLRRMAQAFHPEAYAAAEATPTATEPPGTDETTATDSTGIDATTTGTVLESDIDPEASAQRSDYTPTVRYAYPVDGVDYENDNVRAGSDPLSRQGGTVLLGEYHEDATVTVHYDPVDPDRSVLVPPAGGQAWLLFVAAGLLVAVIAGGLAVLGP